MAFGRVALNVRGVTNLAEQLAAQELAQGVRAGSGVILAGGTSFRNAQSFANQYGGDAADWVKKSTTASVQAGDYTYQIHWAENLKTGQIADVKLTTRVSR